MYKIEIYRITGNIGGQFSLAVGEVTVNIKSVKFNGRGPITSPYAVGRAFASVYSSVGNDEPLLE